MRKQDLGKRTVEIVEYRFANPTITQKAIADHFGLSEGRIANILRSERVQAVYPVLARKAVKNMIPKAVDALNDLITQKGNLKVRLEASDRVLNTEKVLEPAPLVQINAISTLKIDELRKLVDEAKALPPPSIDPVE